MDLPEKIFYDPNDYISTGSGNTVSRKTLFSGSQNISVLGKTIIREDCIFRGDFGPINLGRYVIIGKGSVIRGPYKKYLQGLTFLQVTIGDHVIFEDNVVSSAVEIGSYVHIGANSVIGRRSVINECSIIHPNTVIPPETKIPAYSIFAGNPGEQIGNAPEDTMDMMIELTKTFYARYAPSE
ncbi:hypothetical protein SNEBB_005236 [Seison nebaliae]|nr:hypothetical protein SNEBB_005236 [Seison nebaliae]